MIVNKKKKNCQIVDLTIPVDHRVKIKEKIKREKYLDLAKGLKMLWHVKVVVIQIVNGALDTRSGRVGNQGTS